MITLAIIDDYCVYDIKLRNRFIFDIINRLFI